MSTTADLPKPIVTATEAFVLCEIPVAEAMQPAYLPDLFGQEEMTEPSSEIHMPDGTGENTGEWIYPHAPKELTAWTEHLEHEFDELMIRIGEKIATAEEKDRYRWLKSERRRIKAPRSADEILREYSRQRAMSEVMEAMGKYVDFYRRQDCSEIRSG